MTHPRIYLELDRRAAIENISRTQLRDRILWESLFPGEPMPVAKPKVSPAAHTAFLQSKQEWLEARDRWCDKFSVNACPQCHKPKIKVTDDGYRCQSCGAIFQEPARRAAVPPKWIPVKYQLQ